MSLLKGPDPDFPYFDEDQRFAFPPPEKADSDSIIAWGGNLSPGMLLSAYEQGLFPWYSDGEPIIWHSPNPRYVLFRDKLKISSSMKKILRQGKFNITLDRDFSGVISGCAEIERPGQRGTWITRDMINAYIELHRLGWAHSSEAWFDGELAGGCYGIRLGNVFFGESMFARRSNASKAAFIHLAGFLFDDEIQLIDCQTYTPHLESLGAEPILRSSYIKLLKKNLGFSRADKRGSWTILQ